MNRFNTKSNHTTILRVMILMIAMSFGLAAKVSAQSNGERRASEQAGRLVTLEEPSRVKFRNLAKIHMTVTVLETRGNYKPGMTGDAFVASVLSRLRGRKVPPEFGEYLRAAFVYHPRNMTPEDIYDQESGEAFLKAFNGLLPLARRIHKNGMSEEAFLNAMVPSIDGGPPLQQRFWLNLLRKIIDWLDDHVE